MILMLHRLQTWWSAHTVSTPIIQIMGPARNLNYTRIINKVINCWPLTFRPADGQQNLIRHSRYVGIRVVRPPIVETTNWTVVLMLIIKLFWILILQVGVRYVINKLTKQRRMQLLNQLGKNPWKQVRISWL